ncbi:MAG: helix-turn-helix domain-containing protein [Lachnospiraceae bacterium]|nr:helix-turn-helix domain-containing protein [Lachnospiraceae bacterium]
MKIRAKSIIRLAFPYAITVLLPIISVFCLGAIIVSNYSEKVLSDRQRNIMAAVERLDYRIESIEEMSYVIDQNNVMTDYVINGLTGNGNGVIDCLEVMDLLSTFTVSSELTEIYFYDANEERIITSDSTFSSAEVFFRYKYRFEDYSLAECIERLKSTSRGYGTAEKVILNNSEMQAIEYKISVPVGKFGKNQSQLILIVDVKSLFSDFFDLLGDGGEIYVYSHEELVYGSGDRYAALADKTLSSELELIEGEEETVYGMEIKCKNVSWKVKLFVPELAQINNNSLRSTNILWLIVVPVLLSVCMCIYFTYRNHREILELLIYLKGDKQTNEWGEISEEVGYKSVRKYVGRIINENSAYREHVAELHSSQKNSALERLVHNADWSAVEKREALKNIELQVRDDTCVVMCVQFEDISDQKKEIENGAMRDMIIKLLDERAERSCEIFDVSSREIVCVLSGDHEMETIFTELISMLTVEVQYQCGIELKIGVGNAVDSIYDIGKSYEQAKAVIRYSEGSGRIVRMYSEIDRLEDVYYYPMSTDDKISNYMVAERAEEVKGIIWKIYEENFLNQNRRLSLDAIEAVMLRIRNAVFSAAEKQGVSVNETSLRPDGDKNIKGYFLLLTELTDRIVGEITVKKKSVHDSWTAKIKDYVQENFADSTLSIKRISAHFGFHENYISNVFKEEYGQNLSVVIEKFRIEKAKELLDSTGMKIGEIAVAVGYVSDSSFRRAFKRLTGVSPAEFRENH